MSVCLLVCLSRFYSVFDWIINPDKSTPKDKHTLIIDYGVIMSNGTARNTVSKSGADALQEPKPEGGLCSTLDSASPVDEGTVSQDEKVRLDDEFEAPLETTWVEKAKRTDEDAATELLVKGIEAELAATESAFEGMFDPPRDGECPMRCAAKHGGLAQRSEETAKYIKELRLLVVARVMESASVPL